MIKLGSLVNLKPLNEEEVFTATNKETGNVSVFKSKASRDAAVDAGSHEMRKDDKEDAVEKPTSKVNIFNKDKNSSKEEPKSSSYSGNSDDMKMDMQNAFDIAYTGKGLKGVKKTKDGFQINMASYMNDNSFKDVLDSFNKTNGTNFVSGDVEKTAGGTRVVISEPKDEPKTDIPSVKPRPADKALVKTVDKFSQKLGLSPEKLGKEEYEKHMLSYIHDALEDANFHSANRQIFADLQGRPELAKRPDYSTAPEIGTPEREEWDMKNSIYNKNFDASVTEFDGSDEAVGALTSQASWEGERIIDSLLDKLRKDGSGELADKIQASFDKDMAKNESTSNLLGLLPEGLIQEGTRSQVGIIKNDGKIVSAYVHYDGYPSNMKPGLKAHMKDAKDVLTLIKKGGARGIFDDKPIEYYKSGTPMKGDVKNISDYIKDAGNEAWADFVYLYNMKDKKWYYADVYKDKQLKKLY